MKKSCKLLLFLLLVLTLTACSLPFEKDENNSSERSTRASRERSDSDEEDEDDEDEDDEESESGTIYGGYSVYYEPGYYSDCGYTIEKEFVVYDDDSCRYTEVYIYDAGNVTTYEYPGTCKKTDTGYTAELLTGYGSDSYTIVIEGNKIVSAEIGEASCGEIAGTYTCNDRNYGNMVIDIQEDGTTVLSTDRDTYSGNIFIFDGNWDFVGDNYEGDSIDWYIYFSGNRFTYESYRASLYSQYAGSYECIGDLGRFVIDVNEEGEASAIISVDGNPAEYSGLIYTSDYSIVVNLSNENDDVYIQLYLYQIGGGDEYEYDGYIETTQMLSVG